MKKLLSLLLSLLTVLSLVACAYGAQQAWNRVSNSHNLGGMDSYKLGQPNIALVGPYTYAPHNYSFMPGDGTPRIIADNGAQVMCESYAAMKPADGLYSSSAWHVMMCSATPVVVRFPDGTIDAESSYMLVCEQRAEPAPESTGFSVGFAKKYHPGSICSPGRL